MSLRFHEDRLFLESIEGKHDLLSLCEAQRLPFYLYDCDQIQARIDAFKQRLPTGVSIHYALKANDHPAIMSTMKNSGLGLDLVSGGELRLAKDQGFDSNALLLSGVAKTWDEIQQALKLQIKQINVESIPELKRIGEAASKMQTRARVALRMNPNVDPKTHPYIRTGFRENKFGLDEETIPEAVQVLKDFPDHLQLVGLTMHIGSQIRELSPYEDAIRRLIPLYQSLRRAGFPLTSFDVGGGIGINYESLDAKKDLKLIEQFGDILKRTLHGVVDEILVEPGRVLVGRFGWLFGEVQYVKRGPVKSFVIVNTGMHHLMRPALYQAHHEILPLRKRKKTRTLYDVVGPICESADVIGYDRMLANPESGDWIVICDVGAYGAVMANRYNAHELPQELVLQDGDIGKHTRSK